MHWYFTSALPRALLSALPLLLLGFAIEKRVRAITVITLLYVAAYSLLPHKEVKTCRARLNIFQCSISLLTLIYLSQSVIQRICSANSVFLHVSVSALHAETVIRSQRCALYLTNVSICFPDLVSHLQLRFLLPMLPLLNIPAAAALAWLWRRRGKSKAMALQCVLSAALVLLSFILACFFLAVSRLNYPGGEALQKLHGLPQATGQIKNQLTVSSLLHHKSSSRGSS